MQRIHMGRWAVGVVVLVIGLSPRARAAEAPPATWLLVKISPSGVNRKPEPLPRSSRCSAPSRDSAAAGRLRTSIFTSTKDNDNKKTIGG